MNLLGISSGFHDAAAALVVDGVIVAAVEEERLTRRKHDPSFPERAADTCLVIGEIEPADIDVVTFHEKPLGVVNRHLASRLRSGPFGLPSLMLNTPGVIRDQLTVGHQIAAWFRNRGVATPAVHYAEHHTSHSAAAFYPSPFASAAVLTVDGVGEWATATLGEGHGRRLRTERELRFPDSVGLLYSAFTAYCGFRVNSGEGELMGLAPFGEPRWTDLILEELVDLSDDGSIELNQKYFAYTRGRRTINQRFERLFGGPTRALGTPPGRREADLAASVQEVTERIVLAMARELHRETGWSQLCLAGGVALNCVANGRLLREGPFDDVWVQPAAGDAGSAIGAALYTWYETLGNDRTADTGDSMRGAFLGPSFGRDEIERWLSDSGVEHRVVDDDDERCRLVAEKIDRGAVVGWFCGRMEFGPRALGHRSILADARSPTVQQRINGLVKERGSFRPFAPAVLADRASGWFDMNGDAPYMTLAMPVHADRLLPCDPGDVDEDDLESIVAQVRSAIPAVTHVNGSARVQTVDAERNPEFSRLLRAFDEVTGCPILLNTSFNARDEPIVCTPDDAYRTFRRTGLDLLVLEHCMIESDR